MLAGLAEGAFEAEFQTTRIEKERRAIMAEAQMMNTIEYRVDCQLLQYLHQENSLGCRFPIGKMDQVSRMLQGRCPVMLAEAVHLPNLPAFLHPGHVCISWAGK